MPQYFQIVHLTSAADIRTVRGTYKFKHISSRRNRSALLFQERHSRGEIHYQRWIVVSTVEWSRRWVSKWVEMFGHFGLCSSYYQALLFKLSAVQLSCNWDIGHGYYPYLTTDLSLARLTWAPEREPVRSGLNNFHWETLLLVPQTSFRNQHFVWGRYGKVGRVIPVCILHGYLNLEWILPCPRL